ncbi:FUSC family protein [Dermacoccaceae bacterium W4C1]
MSSRTPALPTKLDPRTGLSRSALKARVQRLRNRMFLIVQCGVCGALAWSLAHYLLGHAQPFFAPVTVIVALGLTYGQRYRRIIELTTGVAIGVLVGDLFVAQFGTGPMQIAFVIICAMTLAVLAGAGGLIMIQAGVQSMIVTTLVAGPGYAFSRWLDAVVGGCVALLAATITPTSPVRRPRREAATVLREVAEVLRESATAGRRGDPDRAGAALERARGSESLLRSLKEATDEGMAVIRQSPFRRRHANSVGAIAELSEPLDRAVRNLRVLVRRIRVACLEAEPMPPSYLDSVDTLARIVDQMADELQERRTPENVRPALLLLASQTAVVNTSGLGRTSLSGEVVRAQLRSIVVDLLMLTGWSYEKVRGHVPQAQFELEDED